MPSPTQIQNLILSASYVMATDITANLNQMTVGNDFVDWTEIRKFNRNIEALQVQLNTAQYTTTATLTLYDCLSALVGIDTSNNTLDPNAQNRYIIINPAGYIAPMDIPWADFSTDGEVDGGRNTYYNSAWKGVNPFLQDATATLLFLGIDYDVIPAGGFTLLSTGNLPFIYDGMSLRAYNYALIV